MMRKAILPIAAFIVVIIVVSCNNRAKAPLPGVQPTETLFAPQQTMTLGPTEFATPDPSAVFIDAPVEAEYGVFIEDIEHMRIEVYKSDRKLEVYEGQNLAARFKIGLGSVPEGAKQHEGDGKTPEGKYYICLLNDQSKFYLSLGLSYPNGNDARAGLERGDITQEQFDKIDGAIHSGRRPPWNTPLGGEIMIHGSGSDRDWTAGCIALENEDMDYIWEHAQLGTEVLIFP